METMLSRIRILSGKPLTHSIGMMLRKFISRKCKMVYRRSVSITSVPPSSRSPGSSSTENFNDYGKSSFSSDLSPTSISRKRQRSHDEEQEVALFRRVRIKTEIKVLAAEPRNRPSATHVDGDDPYLDPELLRMLKAEKALENELLAESQKTPEQREWEAEMKIEMEKYNWFEDPEAVEGEYEWDAWGDLQEELANEAAVDQELHEKEMLDELPSDSDYENSEEFDSDDSEEDIDMDYRFS